MYIPSAIRYIKMFAIILFPIIAYGQDAYLERLSIVGNVSELGISPSEEIWVATGAGNIYYTKQIGDLWHAGPFGSLEKFSLHPGNAFQRINFLSQDTLIISGFIQKDGKQDFIYRSVDHGKTWDKVVFGESSWLDASFVSSTEKVWMSGSSQLIYYSEDGAKTWKSFGKVEPTGNLRFSTIFFDKDEKTGLFGSFWNVLYRTIDNCQHWEKLPTPLSQKKYKRLSEEDRPDIRKIRIFGDHYVINQQGRIFITKADLIDWEGIPNAIDFEVTNDGSLYTIDRDLKIALYDSSFNHIWQSERKLESFPYALAVKNDKLFALTQDRVYKISPEEFIESPLFTADIPIREPDSKVSFEGEEYGFENKDILRFDKKRKQWYRFMTLDFPIANATLFDNHIVVADEKLREYYAIDAINRTVNNFKLPEHLFEKKLIRGIHFENGSQGCFHTDNSRKSYTKKGGQFVVDNKTTSSKYLTKAANKIDASIIKEMIEIIDSSKFTKVDLADLEITDNDVRTFKDFIEEEKKKHINGSDKELSDFENLYAFPVDHTDFDFYVSISDSLERIDKEDIDQAFWQASGNWSTTTDWRRVILVFQDGKKLIVENSDDKPNYLYTPWLVDYEGLKFKTNSVRFGRLINDLTKGQFFGGAANNKMYAIFKIADYLYRKKLEKEY